MTVSAPSRPTLHGWDWTTADDQRAGQAILLNRTHVEDLAARASRLLTLQRYEEAAVHALAAAECAWINHTGAFADLRLESLLTEISDTLDVPSGTAQSTGHSVLHVLTAAQSVGGHTRLVCRWIASDSHQRRHTVVLTRQAGHPVPAGLSAAARRSGGNLFVLDETRSRLLDHAATLRHLALLHDLVVLHAHPSDVVPLIALGALRSRPRVITLNHADHVFWLGVTISDGVTCLRPSGEQLTVARRGVERDRILSLPIPVSDTNRAVDHRQHGRRALGVTDDAVLAISVAGAYKYAGAYGGPSFAEVLTAACDAIPNLQVLVAGPDPTGAWATAAAATGGRMRALGVQTDTAMLLAAADVYVDSFPCGSATSALEAAAVGLPVLSMPVWQENFPLATSHSPALDRLMVTAAGPGDLVARLQEAASDHAGMAALGDRTRHQVLALHGSGPWQTSLQAMYAAVARLPLAVPQPMSLEPRIEAGDLILSQLTSGGPLTAGPHGSLGSAVSFLPVRRRLEAGIRFLRQGGRLSPYLIFLLLSHRSLRALHRRVPRS